MERESAIPSYYTQVSGDLLKRINLIRFIREFIRASDIKPGYYMEFGVLNGESMIEVYRQLRGHLTHMYGFDSFEGLPELDNEDMKGYDLCPIFHKGNLKGMDITDVARNIVSSCRVPEQQLTLTKGFYEDVLPSFDKAALKENGHPVVIHVDCDIYSASKTVFEFIDDIVQDGTWILLDDYWFYRGSPKHGQRRAFDEWLEGSKNVGATPYSSYRGFGKAFVAYKK